MLLAEPALPAQKTQKKKEIFFLEKINLELGNFLCLIRTHIRTAGKDERFHLIMIEHTVTVLVWLSESKKSASQIFGDTMPKFSEREKKERDLPNTSNTA